MTGAPFGSSHLEARVMHARLVEVDEVDALIGDVKPDDVEIVAVVDEVWVADFDTRLTLAPGRTLWHLSYGP